MWSRITLGTCPSSKCHEHQWLVRESPHLRILPDELADAVRAKLNLAAQSFGRQLAAKWEQLKELQRASRRPNVKSVKEKDVVAALGKLRDLLQGDVGVAAQVLKALVGDVVIETRQVDEQEKPQMVARFSINAVPALAVLERNRPKDRDDAPVSVWGSIHPSPGLSRQQWAAPRGGCSTRLQPQGSRKKAAKNPAQDLIL